MIQAQCLFSDVQDHAYILTRRLFNNILFKFKNKMYRVTVCVDGCQRMNLKTNKHIAYHWAGAAGFRVMRQ